MINIEHKSISDINIKIDQNYTVAFVDIAFNNGDKGLYFGNNDIKHRAEKVLGDIKSFALKYFPQYSDVIEYQIDKTHSGNSYAEIVSRRFGSDYMNKGIALAREYQRSVGYV